MLGVAVPSRSVTPDTVTVALLISTVRTPLDAVIVVVRAPWPTSVTSLLMDSGPSESWWSPAGSTTVSGPGESVAAATAMRTLGHVVPVQSWKSSTVPVTV